MATFKAIVIDKAGEKARPSTLTDFDEADLMDGDVTVARRRGRRSTTRTAWRITGKAPVVRRFPMIPGIDFAGMVETSDASGLEARRPRRS